MLPLWGGSKYSANMKILLVGEYSRLHNSLKKGLEHLGHEVTLISSGDGFKQYPADITLKRFFTKGLAKKWKVLWHTLFGQDLTSVALAKEVVARKKALSGFDVVQLINESPLTIQPKYEREVIQLLKNKNNTLFVLSCGADYTSIKYAHNKKLRYSILSPYFLGKIGKQQASPLLKYLTKPYIALHEFVDNICDGFIASDLDYHLPMQGNSKYKGLVSNPIVLDDFIYSPVPVKDKIIVFHGINREAYYKKGNDIFEQALTLVTQTHGQQFELITVENLPYKEYITKYDSAHIVLDQVYSYDQGFNALEAMAKGKVVFTGAESEFLEYYKLEPNSVAINALPNPEQIAAALIALIDNPERILAIGKAARAFVEAHHNANTIAKNYLAIWSS